MAPSEPPPTSRAAAVTAAHRLGIGRTTDGPLRLMLNGLLGAIGALTTGAAPIGCSGSSPSNIGRNCATERGRSACLTLRQASMAARKPGRYVPATAAIAGAM